MLCHLVLFCVSRVVISSLYLFIVNKGYFILSTELILLFDFTLHTVPCILKHGLEGEMEETINYLITV